MVKPESHTTTTKLAPFAYDAKGQSMRASYACTVAASETVSIDEAGTFSQTVKVEYGKAVYASDRPALYALIRAYQAIIELIEVEIAEHERTKKK